MPHSIDKFKNKNMYNYVDQNKKKMRYDFNYINITTRNISLWRAAVMKSSRKHFPLHGVRAKTPHDNVVSGQRDWHNTIIIEELTEENPILWLT